MVSDDTDFGRLSTSEDERWTLTDAERSSSSREYASLPEGTTVVDADAPVESFMVELESQMLTGHSSLSRRRWASTQGVDRASLKRFEEIIRGTWTVESTTHYVLTQRRDELRQMYREVWSRAMSPGDVVTKSGEVVPAPPDLMVALKTVDSLAKLDGLAMPDVAVQINNGASVSGERNATTTQLTNRTRERTMELLRAAHDRAQKHSEKTTRALTDGRREQQSEEQFKVPAAMGVVR